MSLNRFERNAIVSCLVDYAKPTAGDGVVPVFGGVSGASDPRSRAPPQVRQTDQGL